MEISEKIKLAAQKALANQTPDTLRSVSFFVRQSMVYFQFLYDELPSIEMTERLGFEELIEQEFPDYPVQVEHILFPHPGEMQHYEILVYLRDGEE